MLGLPSLMPREGELEGWDSSWKPSGSTQHTAGTVLEGLELPALYGLHPALELEGT